MSAAGSRHFREPGGQAFSGPSPSVLAGTPAMDRGLAHVEQCGGCGLLAHVPLPPGRQTLGACPACGKAEWWAQRLPVGPFLGGGEDTP